MAPKFKNTLLFISLILNVIFLVLVIIYVVRNKDSLTQKFVWRFNTETMIMLGDSHTSNGNWNDLLNRCDVLNMGYSGFTSGQIDYMMKQNIVNRNASYCFIQCGGNDLNRAEFNSKIMMNNIAAMIHYLKDENITPVLQSLFHRPDLEYNLTIDSLNVGLKQLALQNDIDFIDLNPYLDENNNIIEHMLPDNIHLNQKGYEIWGSILCEYLNEKGIN